MVSQSSAENDYGVILDSSLEPDLEATQTHRTELREQRLADTANGSDLMSTESSCPECGENLLKRVISPENLAYEIEDERVQFEEILCAECSTLSGIHTVVDDGTT
jgi:ribosomal protein S27AE